MRRTLAVVLSTGVLLTWWFCQDLSVKAQGGPAKATENGDVNGDGKRDIADAVSLLTWMFDGGPEPVAFACPPEEDPCDKFASNVAGSFLATVDLPNGRIQSLITLTRDGRVLGSRQIQLGFLLNEGSRQGIEHGTWTTDSKEDREVTTVGLWFTFDGDGNPTGIMKVRMDGTFDETFSELTGTKTAWFFNPGQDPLNDQGRLLVPDAPFAMRRIRAN